MRSAIESGGMASALQGRRLEGAPPSGYQEGVAIPTGITRLAFPRRQLDGDTRFLDPQVIARVSNLELVARFIVEGFLIGLHQSPYHGFSSEFTSYRKYAKGDPFRFIDWKAAARTDRLYIKQFEENTNTRCYLVVDGSASMNFGGAAACAEGRLPRGIPKWLYARSLAAALAYLLVHQGDAAGLAVFRDGPPEVIPPRGGTLHLHTLLGALSRAVPERGTDTEKGLAAIPERLARRGLVILLSDLLDQTEKIITALKAFRLRRHEVIVFHILAPEEREFPYRENLEFVDSETGRALSAQGSYIAAAYRRALSIHLEGIQRFCRQNDIDFVPMTTDELLSTALVGFLSRRKRAR
jgi:uncharacterized protein (DUF58 family)